MRAARCDSEFGLGVLAVSAGGIQTLKFLGHSGTASLESNFKREMSGHGDPIACSNGVMTPEESERRQPGGMFGDNLPEFAHIAP